MTVASMIDGPTLGGLPIHNWYGRVVRIDRKRDSSSQTPWSFVKLISVDGKRCTVKPGGGHGKTETRPTRDLRPCWGENPDLKQGVETAAGMAVSVVGKKLFEEATEREESMAKKKKREMSPAHKKAMMKGREEAQERARNDTTPFYIIDCKFKRVLAFKMTKDGEITAQRVLEWTQDFDRTREYEGVSAAKRAHTAVLKNNDKMSGLEDDDVLRVTKHEWKKVRERWEQNPKADVAPAEKGESSNGTKRKYTKRKSLLDMDFGLDTDELAEKMLKFGEYKQRREELKAELEEIESAMEPVAVWLSRFRK